ncbi:hypothetical protein [Aquimarina sp. 2201CG14-23]|uniref:hypothetical protein n=1 Tax=Aquimarina mycalae TaxID=3040073 RepID=UPI0024782461|nr:hypothetical protein [Aquimarina sp. 2201CG14-23]MDH7448434.1 hypothetical protein [Aquimarina sp. 2201CG14-23]
MDLPIEKIENELIAVLSSDKFKLDINKFDSGALMIDVETENRFFCIQLTKSYIGVSEITEEDPGFSSVPNKYYEDIGKFKKEINELFNLDWK